MAYLPRYLQLQFAGEVTKMIGYHLSGENILDWRPPLRAAATLPVLVMVRVGPGSMPLALARELMVIVKIISSMSLLPVLASGRGRKYPGEAGLLRESLPIADLMPSDYQGILIPHMPIETASIQDRDPSTIIDFVRKFHSLGRTIAAQNSGVLLLARAGILDGRKFAAEKRYAYLAPRGIYMGEGVMLDGNILTASIARHSNSPRGKLDCTKELIQKFLECVTVHP